MARARAAGSELRRDVEAEAAALAAERAAARREASGAERRMAEAREAAVREASGAVKGQLAALEAAKALAEAEAGAARGAAARSRAAEENFAARAAAAGEAEAAAREAEVAAREAEEACRRAEAELQDQISQQLDRPQAGHHGDERRGLQTPATPPPAQPASSAGAAPRGLSRAPSPASLSSSSAVPSPASLSSLAAAAHGAAAPATAGRPTRTRTGAPSPAVVAHGERAGEVAYLREALSREAADHASEVTRAAPKKIGGQRGMALAARALCRLPNAGYTHALKCFKGGGWGVGVWGWLLTVIFSFFPRPRRAVFWLRFWQVAAVGRAARAVEEALRREVAALQAEARAASAAAADAARRLSVAEADAASLRDEVRVLRLSRIVARCLLPCFRDEAR